MIKKYLLPLIMFLSFYGVSSALEPVKVAIINPGAEGVTIEAEVVDIDNPSPAKYTKTNIGSYDADNSGIISFRVGVGDTDWQDIEAENIDGKWVLNVYANSSLYAQYRLDQLLYEQASALMNMDTQGNLVPESDNTQSLGTDDNRWSDIYVGPETVHLGVTGNEATIKYNTTNNEIKFAINGSDEIVTGLSSTTFSGNVDLDDNSLLNVNEISGHSTNNVLTITDRVDQNLAGANIAFGTNALSVNNSGLRNTAIGNNALSSNDNGNENTAVGANSLDANTGGGLNTAIGYNALNSNTTGNSNSAVGNKALENNTIGLGNSANGFYAMRSNTEGDYNTAIGGNALISNTTGSWNAAIGYRSGRSITTGNENVFVGYEAGYNVSQKVDAENSIAIGSGSFTDSDNQVVIGNTSITETVLRGTVTVGSTTIDESSGNTTVGGSLTANGGLSVNNADLTVGSTSIDPSTSDVFVGGSFRGNVSSTTKAGLSSVTSPVVEYTEQLDIANGDLPNASAGTMLFVIINNGSGTVDILNETFADGNVAILVNRDGTNWHVTQP